MLSSSPRLVRTGTDRIKELDNRWGPMSAAAIISRPAISNTIFAMYGTTVTIDWGLANRFFIAVTDTTPFTVSTPNISGTVAVPVDGTEIEVTLRNVSGGAIGNLTWGDGYKTSWNNGADKPANGFNRTIGSVIAVYLGFGWRLARLQRMYLTKAKHINSINRVTGECAI